MIMIFCCAGALSAQQDVNSGKISIRSSAAILSFDLNTGLFDIENTKTGIKVIKQAHFSAGKWNSSDAFASKQGKTNQIMTSGQSANIMEVVCSFPGKGSIKWKAMSYDNKPYFVFLMDITNVSKDTIMLKKWGPMMNGDLYSGIKMSNAKILDGNGGGEATKVIDAGFQRCRNNLLFTFDDEDNLRHSFVAGGIKYADFEKHVLIESDQIRKTIIHNRDKSHGLKMISYIDLGEESYDFDENGTGIIVLRAWPYPFHSAKVKELGTTVYGSKKIILSAKNLISKKQYSVGFSWMDEKDGRIQSVYVDNGEGTTRFPILSRRYLPESSRGKLPEEMVFKLPQKAVDLGELRILVEIDKGPNAVMSEVWLNEGWPPENPLRMEIPYTNPTFFKASIYSQDPVGKRIDPETTYQPSNDIFYVDITTSNPFEALEKYSLVLKEFQNINNLNYYTFPEVCLWYASHRNYGDGPSVNDSPGAVDEMDRAIKSGFTRYAPVGVRLVPDNYEVNNEQGWWDEEHWQKYGSGDDNPNSVVVKGAHYKAPYLTTKSWASAITNKGGIPATYVQTARRSQDFCDTYPQYMLFNESNHAIPDSNWLTLGKSSYDFTDPGFIQHMKKVYKNMKEGGIQGIMFDYTSTAWADWGGMEDKYATAASMYKNVFQLAYDGLGPKVWIHERNLERGTDLTLGLVASQRVWGDTDGITDEMVSRTGLRWYKNRVVVNYDMDSKNTEKLRIKSRDYLRQMLTMAYIASGRLLLGNSFAKMTSGDLFDLSRVYPFHTEPKSARPLDAFINNWPRVYDFKINDQWHILTLYNTSNDTSMQFSIPLDKADYVGGLALKTEKKYYVYDFWNEKFVGMVIGSDKLNQLLRKAEARVLSIHEAKSHPQFISTNRHIMQGFIELSDLNWDASKKIYSGTAKVVANEPFKILIATNGFKPKFFTAKNASSSMRYADEKIGLVELTINSEKNKDIQWTLSVK